MLCRHLPNTAASSAPQPAPHHPPAVMSVISDETRVARGLGGPCAGDAVAAAGPCTVMAADVAVTAADVVMDGADMMSMEKASCSRNSASVCGVMLASLIVSDPSRSPASRLRLVAVLLVCVPEAKGGSRSSEKRTLPEPMLLSGNECSSAVSALTRWRTSVEGRA